ncbi:hypothetical protein M569_04289, partial [Genlisea aurea]
SNVGYEEKRVSLIRKIDFAWAVEREDPSKKQKTDGKEASSSQQHWQWQSLVESLRLAHQELSVIIDLINTVEANDAVTVAGMTRPKLLLNESLSDLSVSIATKLQCFRSLGKYFKQSAKALEEQTAREARFYGALIRLQQNWKIKRHRLVAAASGNEGFYIDLFDNSLHDLAVVFRPSSLCTIPIEHDAASGMLTVSLPPSSCHSLQFEFLGFGSSLIVGKTSHKKASKMNDSQGTGKNPTDDESIQEMNSTLRQVHCAIHDEQVFDLVYRDACNPSLGMYLTGIKEKYLGLRIGEGESVSISLVPTTVYRNEEEAIDSPKKQFGVPNQHAYEIYLRELFHEQVFMKKNHKSLRSQHNRILDHFCKALAHRIFSNKVLAVLENLVHRTPYVDLITKPTWHSRTSSWTISMKLPRSILDSGSQTPIGSKNVRSKFWTKVTVIDDSIRVEGEGAPSVVGLFKGRSESVSGTTTDGYDCDLVKLPIIILLQVGGQIIEWLYEEALIVGLKVKRDFLSLRFELEGGETVRLVGHVDPEDAESCLSWWLMVGDDDDDGPHGSKKFLGYLPLHVLHSTLLDFFNLCTT